MKFTKPRPKRQTVGSKRVTKYPYICKDGPWEHQTLYLESGHTLVMTINGQTGRYVKGEWKCA